MTPQNIIWKYEAPTDFNASITSPAMSSIVSEKARVKYPNVIRNNARKPVNWLCLKENTSINDQATIGIFLKNEAITFVIIFVKMLIPVEFEPIIARNRANIAEIVVEVMASKTVCKAEFMISGKYWRAFCVGMNFCISQKIPAGIEENAIPFWKPEIMEDIT